MLDQQDPINAKRRNDVSCRSIPVKCLREYTQYQNLLQLHSSQLSLKDCQCLRETCVIPAVLGKPSALIESNREHNQAHSLPEVLSISPNLNKNKLQHKLPRQVSKSPGLAVSATNPVYKQQASVSFVSHFNSIRPTRGEPVSSTFVSWCSI